ncbi:L-threonylcarbamoyladenylate synthase [Chloroflexota bacterium]
MAAKIEAIDADNPDFRILERAAELISEGEVVVCPTDTGYAFAANALDEKAIVRVFNLKGRSFANPIHVAVSSIDEAKRYAHVSQAVEHLARSFLPGALTIVLPKKDIIPSLLVSGLDTIGIRIPDNRVIIDLATMTSLPITTTSANISGSPTPYTAEEVVDQLGETIKDVALVLDQGSLYPPELSTIIDLTVSPPQLLRQGCVSWEKVMQAWQSRQDSG